MAQIETIRNQLKASYAANKDQQMVELIDVHFEADEDYIIRKPNYEYIQRELAWYVSQSLFVADIPGEIPTIWKHVASKFGKINSNYGWCIFSKENGNQYDNVLDKLLQDESTRQAMMIYTRPSMHTDATQDDMQDFMCTAYTHHFIRNNELVYIVYQRSCDAVFGFNNDVAWHQYVYDKLHEDLASKYPDLKRTNIRFNIGSLHVYPRHYKFL